MIQAIRNSISKQPKQQAKFSLFRLCSHTLLVAYLFLFVSDSINLDVLIASFSEKVNFVDDVAISDSLFNTDSGTHSSVFDQASIPTNDQQLSFHKTTVVKDFTVRTSVYEDVDSSGIEDAQLSTLVSQHVVEPTLSSDRIPDQEITTIDRVISFQQILI